jgi:hypothetical protein
LSSDSLLAHSPRRDAGRKVGPYNIDPFAKEIEGHTVQMEFGPFSDLRIKEIHDFHRSRLGSAPRPNVPREFFAMAEIILERVSNGLVSFPLLAERIRDLNPSLNLRVDADGSISKTELAYVLRIIHLRALERSVDELTQPR